MLITFTFQPNKTNCSKRKLIEDFAYTLKRFYRKTFGSRYYKHKDKQFKFTIFYFIIFFNFCYLSVNFLRTII